MSYGFIKVGTNTSNQNFVTFTPTNNSDLLMILSNTSAGSGTPTVTGITDNLTSSYSTALATTSYSGTSFWLSVFYLPISNTGITTITLTYNGGTPGTCSLGVFEYSGLATVSPLINVSAITNETGAGTGANAIVGPTINVTSAPAMFWGVAINNNNHTSCTAGSGFTRRDSGSILLNNSLLPEDIRITGTGNTNATWTDATNGATDQYFMWSAAFKESALNTGITPTVGAVNVNGVAGTATPAANTKITPFVARKSGLLVPDDRVLQPNRKIFLPTYYKRAA